MANLLFGLTGFEAQAHEESVRSTLKPVEPDRPVPELDSGPDVNEQHFAGSNVEGLQLHQVEGHTSPTEKYSPWWGAAADSDYESRINRQVSSSGTAAAREAAGIQGHGTMQYTDTIEPQVNPEIALGAGYFMAPRLGANEFAGDYMEPQFQDAAGRALASSFATQQSHDAAQATLYGQWLGSV